MAKESKSNNQWEAFEAFRQAYMFGEIAVQDMPEGKCGQRLVPPSVWDHARAPQAQQQFNPNSEIPQASNNPNGNFKSTLPGIQDDLQQSARIYFSISYATAYEFFAVSGYSTETWLARTG